MNLLRKRIPGIRLLIQCSLYPSDDSRSEYEKCVAEVTARGLGESVIFDTRFLSIEDLHERVSAADLAILPYDESNEGGSASAATCLAAGVPLLLSRSQIFDESRAGADTLASTTPREIADAIAKVLLVPEEYPRLSAKGTTYANEHSAKVVAARLVDILRLQRRDSYSRNAVIGK
jgi:glycosyltransferase involved in cell wall biosynthesis